MRTIGSRHREHTKSKGYTKGSELVSLKSKICMMENARGDTLHSVHGFFCKKKHVPLLRHDLSPTGSYASSAVSNIGSSLCIGFCQNLSLSNGLLPSCILLLNLSESFPQPSFLLSCLSQHANHLIPIGFRRHPPALRQV